MMYVVPRHPRYRSDAEQAPLRDRIGFYLAIGIIVAFECAAVVALIRGLLR